VKTEEKLSRAHRRTHQAQARKSKHLLLEVCQLVTELFKGDSEDVKNWLYTPIDIFDGDTPLECVIDGEGKRVVTYLKEQLQLRKDEESK